MLIKYKIVIVCTLRLVGGGAEKKKTNFFTPPPTATENRTAHEHQIGVGMLLANTPACLPVISIELSTLRSLKCTSTGHEWKMYKTAGGLYKSAGGLHRHRLCRGRSSSAS